MYELIDHNAIQCFNESISQSCKNVIRSYENKYNFENGQLKSGYGKDMVLVIPFTCEVRVKCISLVGGDDGEAPETLKVYKNESNVDINL